MMTDDQILEVVRAHKEGKKIEQRDVDHRELGWRECPFPNWDFYRVDFRVAPEPPKELWLQDCGEGIWQEKFLGQGTHFIESTGATSGEPTVVSDAVKASQEINPPRKPREWTIIIGNEDAVKWGFPYNTLFHGDEACVRVREVLE